MATDINKMTRKDKIELFLLTVGVLITLSGAIAAWVALDEYKMTNKVSRISQLQEIERDLTAMNMDKPFLDGIWTITPKEISGKERADMLIEAIWNTAPNNNDHFPQWSTVEDLENILYESKALTNDGMQRLRQTYLYIESILYLVADAYQANKQNLLNEDEVATYYAYLNTLGDHPLFLHAVWFGHTEGYLRKDFSIFLRNVLLKDKDKKETISKIYPELLDDNWVSKLKK